MGICRIESIRENNPMRNRSEPSVRNFVGEQFAKSGSHQGSEDHFASLLLAAPKRGHQLHPAADFDRPQHGQSVTDRANFVAEARMPPNSDSEAGGNKWTTSPLISFSIFLRSSSGSCTA